GYDPAFGARPLKRLLQKEILDPLASEILGGRLRSGMTARIEVTGAGDDRKLEIHTVSQEEESAA
ncbi:MAG: hypothetical protein KC636_37570, partial [Myxococcales bacterium]|nr:hypothetical protein [Myxococcales bacterium]